MNLLVTNAGLAALVNAEATGTETITISEIKFGLGQYTPTKTQTAMQTPFKTLTALSGGAVSANTLHVTAEDASTETYTVYEVGVFLSDGTLFAVGSQTTPILQKASGAVALLSVDIALADHSAATVTVGDTNFFNPQATTEVKGVVELATADETKAGTDAARAVTPASLKAELDVRDSKVVHTTGNETIAGTKTFTTSPISKQGTPRIHLQSIDAVKGTVPSASKWFDIPFNDSLGIEGANRIAALSACYNTNNEASISIVAYKPESGSNSQAQLSMIYPADGSPYATAPTPSDANDSSTKIATTAWVQTLAGKYLPLAGGTITGSILSTINYPLKSSVDDSLLALCGGTEWTAGAALELSGKDRSTGSGNFLLKAQNSDARANLTGKPDGTLTWNNKNIVRTINGNDADASGNIAPSQTGCLPLSGGAMTNPVAVKRDVSNSYLGLYGGTDEADGAELDLYGKDSAAYPGRFTLGASDGTNASALRGLPNGTLTWNEKSVLTSDNEKTLKYLIDEAQFSVDALGKSFHYGLLWLGVENFEDTADVNTSVGAGGSLSDFYDATNHLIVKTGSGSIVLQSTSQTCAKNNAMAWAYPDWTGTGSLMVEISRDGGTTFTTVTSDTMTSISSQPTGTSMVCRLTLTGQVTLKNIAWGCK